MKEAVLLCREDVPGDKHLAAYLVINEKDSLETADVRGFIQQKLPSYMVPSFFVFLDSLPLTPNGKVDRELLPQPKRAKTAESETGGL